MRRRFVSRTTEAGLGLAPYLPLPLITGGERLVAALGARLPVVAAQVERNLRAAGVWSPQTQRDYFRRVAEHLAGGLRVFRFVRHASAGMAAKLREIVHAQIEVDSSIDLLRAAAAGGHGVIVIGTHIANYLLVLARIHEVLPLTVFLRHSRDPRRAAAKEMWCHATGLDFIAEPADPGNPLARAEPMVAALRAGRVLVITPDLPQKRGEGAAVRLGDREIWLPEGPAALSVVTGAPLVAATARLGTARRGGLPATCVRFDAPPATVDPPAGRGWKQAAIAARMQWFADQLWRFQRESPAQWFLWGDSRWSRVFADDARYARRIGAGEARESRVEVAR